MIKWLIIGVVIWYFYRRFQKKISPGTQNDPRYIRDDDFQSGRNNNNNNTAHPIDEDDYIDYEEVK